MKKILVVNSFGIGNTVTKLPMLNLLLQMGVEITIVEEPEAANVIRFFNSDLEAYIYPKEDLDNLAKWADYIIITSPAKRFGIEQEYAHKRIKYTPNGGSGIWNISEVYANVLSVVKLAYTVNYQGSFSPLIKFTDRQFSKEKNSIGIHTGCLPNWPMKRWSAKKWSNLIEELKDSWYQIKLFGLDSDFVDNNGVSLLELGDYSKYRIQAKTRTELFDQISQCEWFISSDSGLGKISAATDCKTIQLFGPTDTVKNSLGNGVNLIKGISCSPCQYDKHRLSSCGNRRCMDFTVSNVLEAMENYDSISGEHFYKV